MSELELRLSALRDEIAWPETPWLEPALDRGPGRTLRRACARSRSASPLLLVVLAGVLAFAPGPGARSSRSSAFAARRSCAWTSCPRSRRSGSISGDRVSREEAERRVGFELVDLGEPDGIYVRGHAVSLVYGPPAKPRLVLTQLRGGLWDGFVKKSARAGRASSQ